MCLKLFNGYEKYLYKKKTQIIPVFEIRISESIAKHNGRQKAIQNIMYSTKKNEKYTK